MVTSDLHPLLFDGVYFRALAQRQQVARLIHPRQEILSQSLPALVRTSATCTSMQTPQVLQILFWICIFAFSCVWLGTYLFLTLRPHPLWF